jgi:hypothetical protein
MDGWPCVVPSLCSCYVRLTKNIKGHRQYKWKFMSESKHYEHLYIINIEQLIEDPHWNSTLQTILRPLRPFIYPFHTWFLVNDKRQPHIPFYVCIFIYNSLNVSNTSCSSSGETNCVSKPLVTVTLCWGRVVCRLKLPTCVRNM